MSDPIREVLMEDAARIQVTPMTWQQVYKRSATVRHDWSRRQRKRRVRGYGAGAAVLALLMLGASGFVSPAMAATLHKIPVIGSLYSFEIPRMNQYASNDDPSVTDHGITISVPKVYYDGAQLDMIYEIQVPQGYHPLAGSQIGLPDNVLLNGKPLSFESVQGADSLVSENTYRGEIDWNLSSAENPQNGTLTLSIGQVGTVRGNWTLSVPISGAAVANATHSMELQGVSRSAYGITLTAKRVSIGPVWTTVAMEMRQPLQADGKPRYEMSYRDFEFGASARNKGIWISYVGSVPNAKIIGSQAVWDFTLRFETQPNDVKSVMVEPVWFGSTPGPVQDNGSGFLPKLSQLALTVPLQ
ncbi:MAG: DUF4179 domain-containing protein [Alicyclobacillus sp.]|nr:DUF4179 domain-containing protein [Alicyclobacillus sp.]